MSATLAEPDTGATLDLISRLAAELAHALGAEHMPFHLHEPDARYELLDQARALLIQCSRTVSGCR
jgi:urease accessory protein UreE